jgi:hypothetical protein
LNFYNLDMHISIIHDVKTILGNLGHNVDSDNLSYHASINGEKTTANKVINRKNFDRIDDKVCEKFYKKYRKKLAHYDAFIHSYPPVFALLFERFEKPIITIACTRFDYPVAPFRFDWYVNKLQSMQKSGQLIPIANNLLDKKICEQHLSFEWKHISSLCSYMTTRYQPKKNSFALWTRSELTPANLSASLDPDFTITQGYNRDSISNFKGVVHLPYNLSIMSAFEQYYQNIPLFFPSEQLQKELYVGREDMLGEILFSNSSVIFESEWVGLADWYDQSNMSDITYFDSLDSIDEKINSVDLDEISSKMRKQNHKREQKIVNEWENLVRSIS